MFDRIKEKVLNMVLSREFVIILLMIASAGVLIMRIFNLQIVNGASYLENFQLLTQKERFVPASRGNIYDRNGNLLAYNELAYSVTIEDVYESGKTKNRDLNNTILQTLSLIKESGDHVDMNFGIYLDRSGNFQFSLKDNALVRFLADVYGHGSVNDLTYREKTSTANEVIEELCSSSRYGIGEYSQKEDGSLEFKPGEGLSNQQILQVASIRYAMSANSYQKYITTTIAKDVSDKTVAVISEHGPELTGIAIAEDTIRKYNNSVYFSQVIGYTGKMDAENLEQYKEYDENYTLNDQVGLAGIESTMEQQLHGKKGSETIYVDNTGKVIEEADYVESVAGEDIYLTLDQDVQIAAYNILEQKIAGIVWSKIENIKEYQGTEHSGSSDIKIAIYDVYNALIENSVIDVARFDKPIAGDTEHAVAEKFDIQKEHVLEHIREEMMGAHTTYDNLPVEYQVYMLYIISMLGSDRVLLTDQIDTEDEIVKAWKVDENISIYEYLMHCIAMNWVDVTKLNIDETYADASEVYEQLVNYSIEQLREDTAFDKRVYKYMIKNDVLTGKEVCQILCEQHIVDVNDEISGKLYRGEMSAFQFMKDRVQNLDITPAQLALEPCTGSLVVTDVNNGEVLALVSYPSYDNNRLATMDADYYVSLTQDKSTPMYNHATQERTAPGSTFKMVSATAGLVEGVIDPGTKIKCFGPFEKITPSPKCWISPGYHGDLTVAGGITNSCNNFFYEVGYRMGCIGESYDSDRSLAKLKVYADEYGLTDTSGIEIAESAPQFSDEDAVRSAIGQGSHNYTTVGLSRYVSAVANSGTCYDLTLIDKVTDHNGNLLKKGSANIRNTIEMDPYYWTSIHNGMRGVVENMSYFDIGVEVAGKTGTAQQSTSHPNHALFVSYAPFDKPEISVTVRIVNGYSSAYAAQTAKDFYEYYYHLVPEKEVITGKATPSSTAVSANTD